MPTLEKQDQCHDGLGYEQKRRKRRDAIPKLLDLNLLSTNQAGSELEMNRLYKVAGESLLWNMKTTRRLLSDLKDELNLLLAFHDETVVESSELQQTVTLLKSLLRYKPDADALFADKLQPMAENALLGGKIPCQKSLAPLCRSAFLAQVLANHIRRYAIDLSTIRKEEPSRSSLAWSNRSETVHVTLFEMLEHEAEILHSTQSQSPCSKRKGKEPVISTELQAAWRNTGHYDAVETLLFLYKVNYTDDALERMIYHREMIFRDVCCGVLVSMDQWCPLHPTRMQLFLGDSPRDWRCLLEDAKGPPRSALCCEGYISCGVSTTASDSTSSLYSDEPLAAPVPRAAINVLNKVSTLLERQDVVWRVMRRILPLRRYSMRRGREDSGDSVSSLQTTLTLDDSVDNQLFLSRRTNVNIYREQESIVGIIPSDRDVSTEEVIGVGKTTNAAMVAHHVEVRKYYSGGVVWLSFDHRHQRGSSLTYLQYRRLLQEVLAQINAASEATASGFGGGSDLCAEETPAFPEHILSIGENHAGSLREEVEDGFKAHCFEKFGHYLRKAKSPILLILDNVPDNETLSWFRFDKASLAGFNEGLCLENKVSVLVTTRNTVLVTAADAVTVDVFPIEDSVSVLLPESRGADSALHEAIASAGLCNPLYAASVARLLDSCNGSHLRFEKESFLRSICAAIIAALARDGLNCLRPEDVLAQCLQLSGSRTPSPATESTGLTMRARACLKAFVAVFCDTENSLGKSTSASPQGPIVSSSLEPRLIPLSVVDHLFRHVILEQAPEERLKSYSLDDTAAQVIRMSLVRLGVLHQIEESEETSVHKVPLARRGSSYVTLMHPLFGDYANSLYATDTGKQVHTMRWHKSLAESVLRSLFSCEKEESANGVVARPLWGWTAPLDQPMWGYALAMLPSHMISGGLHEDALRLLTSKSFIHDRVFQLGVEEASERLVAESACLLTVIPGSFNPKPMLQKAHRLLGHQVFELLQQEISSENPNKDQAEKCEVNEAGVLNCGRAFLHLATSLTELRFWETATPLWEHCRTAFVVCNGERSETHAMLLYNVGIMYGTYLHRHDDAIHYLEECLEIRRDLFGGNNILCAEALGALSDEFIMIGEYDKAKSGYKLALDLLRHKPRLHRKLIGELQERLGIIHFTCAEVDIAVTCFQSAILYKQAEHGEASAHLSTVYSQLGVCYVEQDEPQKALETLAHAISLLESKESRVPRDDSHLLKLQAMVTDLKKQSEVPLSTTGSKKVLVNSQWKFAIGL